MAAVGPRNDTRNRNMMSVRSVVKACNTMMLMKSISSMSMIDIMQKCNHKDGGRTSICVLALSMEIDMGMAIQG